MLSIPKHVLNKRAPKFMKVKYIALKLEKG